ncbi:MAG: DUF547 domain-containing protein [Pseudomonadota bacterium]
MKLFRLFALLTIWMFSVGVSAQDDHWAQHNPNEKAALDGHVILTQLIDTFWEDGKGLTFEAMKGQPAEVLQKYLGYLQKIPVTKLNRDEQLAYWLNLHNAGVIHLLVSRDIPTEKKGDEEIAILSKQRGTPEAPGSWWQEKIVTVEGRQLSLADIEQDILLRHWADPMTVYGIYDATKGGPGIAMKAFAGKTVHEQLIEAARTFINNEDRAVKLEGNNATLSSLYLWHKSVFGDNSAVVEHLKNYADKSLAAKLSNVAVKAHQFSWEVAQHVRPAKGFAIGSGANPAGRIE